MSSILDLHPSRLLRLIETESAVRKIVLFDAVDSTNLIGDELAKRESGKSMLLVADSQQKGKGRNERSWLSTVGKSLTFSIIIEATENQAELNMIMAYSIVIALEGPVGGLMIKWPNDIYLNGKKLAGILSEASGDYIVIGVGMNVNESVEDFSPEIEGLATSLKMVKNSAFDRGIVLSSIINAFDLNLTEWRKGGLKLFKKRIVEKLLYLGRMVALSDGKQLVQGRYVDITDGGMIVIEYQGKRRSYSSGDLSLKEMQ